jgi:hypothetical protein
MGMLSIEACTIRTFLVESANRRLLMSVLRQEHGHCMIAFKDLVERVRGMAESSEASANTGDPSIFSPWTGSSMNHDLNEYPTLETIPVKGPALESRPTSRRSSATSSPGRAIQRLSIVQQPTEHVRRLLGGNRR